MSIQVRHLTKQYGIQKVLDDISFKVNPGEIVGFLGPNGAGKTTTMKSITCFIPVQEGKIEVCDLDVRNHPQEVQRKIGYLPENNPLYKDMFVREYLEFVSSIHQLPKRHQRMEEIIDLTGLRSHAHKRILELSKGYRQRVGLAQALIHNPEVLILDEPTTGLDPNQIVEIRHIIKEIGQNKTVLLSTHILQEVEALCDRVIILNKGKIIASGTPEAIKKQIHNTEPVVVAFDRPVNQQLFASWPMGEIEKVDEMTWKVFPSPTVPDVRSTIFDLAVNNHIKILEMYRQQDNLEGAFRHLTANT